MMQIDVLKPLNLTAMSRYMFAKIDFIFFLKFFKRIFRRKFDSGPISRTVLLREIGKYNILRISGMKGIGKSGEEGVFVAKKGGPVEEVLSQTFCYN